ncbi:NAD dependent epimerase/dehydratase, putative [Metarhizium acridum CQMa 102]|uniref:NAD dependent epimerase/dehydratase, putative n=1 Tax=Metarhizium acridum (strain CQMa 102) TaxID=655827 RepID=E9DS04_METAQ|nr:NAD dependent epimerase/dehydratase, putative [Metarhizium acridum CQMa 102]EFY93586.1 NAD dependent epimerase/dehydratase, putative [Metarhizium acridum CQMa 102]
MTKVLLTAHILDQLLSKGHTVITTVRSEQKAKPIRDAYKDKGSQLEVVVVGDIAKDGAFDEVVKKPGLEVVLHTASPFHFKWKVQHAVADAQKELIDPAVIGTTGILKAIKRSAPTVKRVVVTSSFAAVLDEKRLSDASHTFTEESWNPVGTQDLHSSPATAYRLSKTLAEKAAWDFVAREKPGFDLATICPPLVFGPVAHHLASLESINTSNERAVALVGGGWNDGIPATGPVTVWVDVRDTALAHIRAMERPEAGGRRHLAIGGRFRNRDIAEIAWAAFPELGDKLPKKDVEGGGAPPASENFKYNNDATTNVLGMKWTSLESSITDLIRSLKEHGI